MPSPSGSWRRSATGGSSRGTGPRCRGSACGTWRVPSGRGDAPMVKQAEHEEIEREDAAQPDAREIDVLADRLHPEVNRAQVLVRFDERFVSGTAPDPLPDGFLPGRLLATTTWAPLDGLFRRVATGELDPGVDVLKIDYDFEANPDLMIRRILGELVQVAPGRYLGKVLLRARGRFHPIGFFSLRTP